MWKYLARVFYCIILPNGPYRTGKYKTRVQNLLQTEGRIHTCFSSLELNGRSSLYGNSADKVKYKNKLAYPLTGLKVLNEILGS
jgi:hypothetical protein